MCMCMCDYMPAIDLSLDSIIFMQLNTYICVRLNVRKFRYNLGALARHI